MYDLLKKLEKMWNNGRIFDNIHINFVSECICHKYRICIYEKIKFA